MDILFEGYIGYNLTASYIREQFSKATTSNPTLLINSVGGYINAGNAIINEMQRSGKSITGLVTGMAASFAGVILQKCDKRVMYKNSSMMLHRVGSGGYGNADQIQASADNARDLENQIIEAFATRSGKTEKYIKDKYFNGADNWLTAEKALKEGFIDEIIEDKFAVKLPSNFAKQDLSDRMNFYAVNMAANYNQTNFPQNQSIEMDYKENYEKEKAKVEDLQKALNAANSEKATVLVEAAINAGKIPASQKPIYILSATNDFENTKKALDEIVVETPSNAQNVAPVQTQPAQQVSVQELIKQNQAANAANRQTAPTQEPEKDFEWYQKNDWKALEKMEAENNVEFEKLRNAHAAKVRQKRGDTIKY
ncbi:Clp protease ClpP [Bernardetia sp. Wsw4-3y2]|uniref:Clp protease ClpP n=1 Tax=Bernardetia sp. Wsw4-3y2 TaxID=3127471 RepID=UPI0030D60200